MRLALFTVALCLLAISCGEDDRVCLSGMCRTPGKPSPECASYIDCYYRTGGTPGSLDSTYGRGGTCWTNGTGVEDSCTAACRPAIASLRAAYPDAGCTAPQN